MLGFVDPLMAYWETGSSDLSDSAYYHAAVDSNNVVALGTRGYNGILAKEVLQRIANAPNLSTSEREKGYLLGEHANTRGYYGTNFGATVPEIEDYMSSHIAEARDVQDAMSQDQLNLYFKKPIEWYDDGILTDPRSIAMIGQFGGYGPAHIGRMYSRYGSALRDKRYSSDDLTNTFEVMKQYYANPSYGSGATYINSKFNGHLNRFKDVYTKLQGVPKNYFINGKDEVDKETENAIAEVEDGKGTSRRKFSDLGKGFKKQTSDISDVKVDSTTETGKGFAKQTPDISDIKISKVPNLTAREGGSDKPISNGKGDVKSIESRIHASMNENSRRSSSRYDQYVNAQTIGNNIDTNQIITLLRHAIDYLGDISTNTRDTATGIEDMEPSITTNYNTTEVGGNTVVQKSGQNGTGGMTPGMSKNEKLARKIARGNTRVVSYT